MFLVMGHIEVYLATWLTRQTNQFMAKTCSFNYWFILEDVKRYFKLKYYIIFWSHTGLINGYSAEYDALIDTVINKTSSLNNVSIILRKYNTSENINLFHQGEILWDICCCHRLEDKTRVMAVCRCDLIVQPERTSRAIKFTHPLPFRFLLQDNQLDNTDLSNVLVTLILNLVLRLLSITLHYWSQARSQVS